MINILENHCCCDKHCVLQHRKCQKVPLYNYVCAGQHVLAADSQPDLEDWMESIKQVMQEDRLKRRRTKAQSRVMTSDEDTLLESFSDSGLSYKNKVDSGKLKLLGVITL